jgi:hypothetical protein
MSKLAWDATGERLYETGVDHGVLYIPNTSGVYDNGYAWNGLTTLTESPSGAESNPQYADNIKYLNLLSVEEFGGTIEAFTYPDEFAQCDGTATPQAGVYMGQQSRKTFGLSYRTKVGNDVSGNDFGYKLHLVYNALAAPSEKAYATVNDSPEAMAFSWEFTTTPVAVSGTDPATGKPYKPTASMVIDSTKVDATALAALEDALYGTVGQDPRLPTPTEVIAFFSGSVTSVTPTMPTYNASTDIVTIPSITGVDYYVDGELVPAGAFGPITEDVFVEAQPQAGYKFPAGKDNDWTITFS